MDGGLQPVRPEELGPNEIMGDGGNGAIFLGTKSNMMCGTYGMVPKLLPTSRTAETKVPQTVARVPKGDNGHYAAWVEAALEGYGSEKAKNLSSHFDIAGPLTESVLMGNLAIRSYYVSRKGKNGRDTYPGRNIKLMWDGPNLPRGLELRRIIQRSMKAFFIKYRREIIVGILVFLVLVFRDLIKSIL
jgi:hypothetical protein